MPAPTIDEARAAKAKALELPKNSPCVVGVGIARLAHGYGVKVNLRRAAGEAEMLPEAIDDVPVSVEVVGTISIR